MKGFTLLEILVAVAILGVAMVSLLGLHARNVRLASETQDLTVAAMLASRLATVARASDYPAIGTEEGTFTDDDVLNQEEFGEEFGGPLAADFVWTREVDSRLGLQNVRSVRISVGRADAQPLVVFDFLVRKGGP